ncbi:MAG TPA: hypothetical protein VIG91_01040 [Terriglobales bacterium]
MKKVGIISPRLLSALAAYALLAVLAWRTMDPNPISTSVGKIQFRLVAVVVLGLFAFRTVIHAVREERATRNEDSMRDLRE